MSDIADQPYPGLRSFQRDEARGIHVRYLGKTMNGHVWNDDLRSDFSALRRMGHSAALMRDIEAMLPPPPAKP